MATPLAETNLHARFLERARAEPTALALTGQVDVTAGELSREAAAVQEGVAPRDWVVCPADPSRLLLAAFIGVGALGATAIVPDAGWSTTRRGRALAGIPGAQALPSWPPGRGAEPSLEDHPTQPFYAGFTSGSTGRPKAFARGHRSWVETMRIAEAAFGLRAGGPILLAAPASLSLGLWAASQGLWLGAPVVLPAALTPHGVARQIHASRPSVVVGVPTLLVAAARVLARGGGSVHAVECVLCAGQRIGATGEAAVLDAFPRAAAYDFYGASELSFVTARRLGARAPIGSVGRPLPGVQVAVGGPGASGHGVGEIWVRSPMLFDGYLQGTGLVQGPTDDGWATVGDLGHLVDGELVLEGRGDEMIVVSGVNVYVEEVESALREHPAVSDACVVGRPDRLRGARLVAVVERDQAGVTERQLRGWVTGRVRTEARPREFSFVPELPRTASGKPDRAAVRGALGR